jgi:hypothetical protein
MTYFRNSKKIWSLFLVILFLKSSLFALDFTAIDFEPKADSPTLFYYDGKDYKEVVLRAKRRSLPARAELGEERILNIYRKNQSPDPNAAPYLTAGSVAVPAEFRRVLLLIDRPEGQTFGKEVNLNVIEESTGSFPRGSYRFVNMSGRKIGILFGDEKVLIDNNDIETLQANVDDGNYIKIQLVGQTGYLYQSTWFVGRFNRELIFLLPNDDEETVRLSMFSQNVRE